MEKVLIDDFKEFSFLSGLKLSEDTKHIAFVKSKMEMDENRYNSRICLYDTEKNHFKNLTSGNESNFIWLDNENILFISSRDEKLAQKIKDGEKWTGFYKININGGEAEKFFEVPVTVLSMSKIDEDNLFFIVSYSVNEEPVYDTKEENDYEVFDEIPFWFNGSGIINKKRNRLYRYNISSNNLIAITDEFTNATLPDLNKDKSMCVFTAERYTDKKHKNNSIFLYDMKNNVLQNISHKEFFSYKLVYFMGDNIIFSGSDMKKHGSNENPHFYIIKSDDKEVTRISDYSDSLWNSLGSDCRYGSSRNTKADGGYLYFISTEWNSTYISRIDVHGNVEKVTQKGGSVDGFDVKNGEIYFIGLKNMKLQELYKALPEEEKQLSIFNEDYINKKYVADPERLTFINEEGTEIEGWILKPFDFDPEKKYPLILDIHGGPKTIYGEVFYHEMQYWASEGYVVAFMNPTGSDGRGNSFFDIRGKYGTVDYNDIMQFVDEIIHRYSFIDKDRMGVTGGSYGGFMTNWIIGHTDRFKVAVSQRSISNWLSKFGMTDIGYHFVSDQQDATPWSDPEKLWWHSPLKYADRVKTPTLFIHSDEDYRCHLEEGIQMFTALKYFGVDSRICIFKGENHELSRSGLPKHRIRRLKEITEWMDKYLK